MVLVLDDSRIFHNFDDSRSIWILKRDVFFIVLMVVMVFTVLENGCIFHSFESG